MSIFEKFACSLLLFPCLLLSNPSQPQVVLGDVEFSQPSSNTLHIHTGDQAVIHWGDFSIDPGELAQFFQLNKDSCVLNRVIGNNISTLFGELKGNGKVALINTNGILVGAEGIVNTGSFIASSLDVTNDQFFNNQEMLFQGTSDAMVVNFGTIQAWDGDVHLIGYQVKNEGEILSPNGTTSLAAGREILIQPSGEKKVLICLSDSVEEPTGTGVENSGKISALQAELKADGNIYALAINQTGHIDAKGVSERNGIVWLVAEEGRVENSGTITTINENQTGAKVRILGKETILLENSHIDVSGDFGGGEALIGGDYLGGNPDIYNSLFTYMDSKASINANANINGDGGKVIIWASDLTRGYGKIEAMGGKDLGDGGFVEVSGKTNLDYRSAVCAKAFNGKPGMLLLDPSDTTLSTAVDANTSGGPNYTPTADSQNIQISGITTSLAGGTSVSVTTSGAGVQTGNVTISNDISWNYALAAAITFSITADGGITCLNSNIENTGAGNSTITLTANGGDLTIGGTAAQVQDITVGGATMTGGINLTAANGAVTIAGSDDNGAGTRNTTVTTTSGTITINGRDVNVSAGQGLVAGRISTVSTTTGPINVTATAVGAVGGNLTLTGGAVANNPGQITSAGGGITINTNSGAANNTGNITMIPGRGSTLIQDTPGGSVSITTNYNAASNGFNNVCQLNMDPTLLGVGGARTNIISSDGDVTINLGNGGTGAANGNLTMLSDTVTSRNQDNIISSNGDITIQALQGGPGGLLSMTGGSASTAQCIIQSNAATATAVSISTNGLHLEGNGGSSTINATTGTITYAGQGTSTAQFIGRNGTTGTADLNFSTLDFTSPGDITLDATNAGAARFLGSTITRVESTNGSINLLGTTQAATISGTGASTKTITAGNNIALTGFGRIQTTGALGVINATATNGNITVDSQGLTPNGFFADGQINLTATNGNISVSGGTAGVRSILDASTQLSLSTPNGSITFGQFSEYRFSQVLSFIAGTSISLTETISSVGGAGAVSTVTAGGAITVDSNSVLGVRGASTITGSSLTVSNNSSIQNSAGGGSMPITITNSINVQNNSAIINNGGGATLTATNGSINFDSSTITNDNRITFNAPSGSILLDNNTSVTGSANNETTLTAGNNITLDNGTVVSRTNPTSTTVTAGNNVSVLGGTGNSRLTTQGQMDITATNGSVAVTGDAQVQVNGGAAPLNVTAGRSVTVQGATASIDHLVAGENLTIICDNLFPVAPGVGTGGFTLASSLSTTGGGELRIYTADFLQNNISGTATINGAPFTGVMNIDDPQNQYLVYFPAGTYTAPYTIFYKIFSVPPPPVVVIGPVAAFAQEVIRSTVVVSEFLDNLTVFPRGVIWNLPFEMTFYYRKGGMITEEIAQTIYFFLHQQSYLHTKSPSVADEI